MCRIQYSKYDIKNSKYSTMEAITADNKEPSSSAAAATTTTSTTKRRNRKKRKKSTSNIDQSQDGSSNNAIITSILNSKLSIKKQAQLKKSTRQTSWYDIHELINVGKYLLLALKLFPSTATDSSSQQSQTELQRQAQQSVANSNIINDDDTTTTPPVGLTIDEYNQLKQALHHVAIWRGKSNDKQGRLSHAIDMTAGLTSVLLMDAERCTSLQHQNALQMSSNDNYNMNDGATTNNNNLANDNNNTTPIIMSQYQLRNTYSTILLRSVNGIADSYRSQRKSTTLSVAYCCSLAGLHPWIVDIRHDASHNDLPTIGVCRIGALELLKFWKEKYWKMLECKVYGGNGDNKISSSNDDTAAVVGKEEGGVYTMAVKCLERYENAVIREAREELLLKQKKKSQTVIVQQQRDEEMVRQHTKKTKDNNNNEDMIPISSSSTKMNTNNEPPVEPATKSSSASNSAAAAKAADMNPWSILNDDKPKKKRKKKKDNNTNDNDAIEEGGDAAAAGSISANNAGANDSTPMTFGSKKGGSITQQPSSSITAKEEKSTTITVSSREYAAEYVRSSPIDIAYSVAIQYLVWGIRGSSTTSLNNSNECVIDERDDVSGPALLTLPSDLLVWSAATFSDRSSANAAAQSTQEKQHPSTTITDTLFEQLRTMYEPFIIAMTNAYPGFIVALIVHLVDALLCLDDVRRRNEMTTSEGFDGGGGDGARSEDDDAIQELDMKRIEQHIEYISKWIRHILSRVFHMHFDRRVGMYVPKVKTQLVLPKPLKTTTSVTEPQSTNIDENDDAKHDETKIISPQPIDLKKKGRKKWTQTQLEYMYHPLDYSSLRDIGFPLNSICDRLLVHHGQKEVHTTTKSSNNGTKVDTTVTKLQQYLEDIIGREERVVFMGLYDNLLDSKTIKVESDWKKGDEEELKKQHQLEKDGILSLEEMEAMFDDDKDADKKNTGNTCDNDPMNADFKDKHGNIDDTNVQRRGMLSSSIAPWTLCKSWDACAIGTMPGYPS